MNEKIKKVIDGLGSILFLFCCICIAYFIYVGFKTHFWISIFTLLLSPIVTYSLKQATFPVVMFVLCIITVNIFCIGSSYSKYDARIKSLFVRGHIERQRNYVEEYEDGEGETVPAHYDVEYSFSPSNN